MGTSIKLEVEPRLAAESAVANERLEAILYENAKVERNLQLLGAGKKSDHYLLNHRMSNVIAVSTLGLLTGTIPTAAIFGRLGATVDWFETPENAIFLVLAFVALAATGAAGYFSGRAVSPVLENLEKQNWPFMLLSIPFVGAVWGLVSGSIGGLVLFGIGAVVGGAIGTAVGAFVFTIFAVLHRLLESDGTIQTKHFLPIAIGATLTVAAFILGFQV